MNIINNCISGIALLTLLMLTPPLIATSQAQSSITDVKKQKLQDIENKINKLNARLVEKCDKFLKLKKTRRTMRKYKRCSRPIKRKLRKLEKRWKNLGGVVTPEPPPPPPDLPPVVTKPKVEVEPACPYQALIDDNKTLLLELKKKFEAIGKYNFKDGYYLTYEDLLFENVDCPLIKRIYSPEEKKKRMLYYRYFDATTVDPSVLILNKPDDKMSNNGITMINDILNCKVDENDIATNINILTKPTLVKTVDAYYALAQGQRFEHTSYYIGEAITACDKFNQKYLSTIKLLLESAPCLRDNLKSIPYDETKYGALIWKIYKSERDISSGREKCRVMKGAWKLSPGSYKDFVCYQQEKVKFTIADPLEIDYGNLYQCFSRTYKQDW